ncbi:CotS family spore coat protein [Heliobacterium gestii]|uniref:CotS family spore coat protein n=1 Tax=Heliomicrobium gestii TaxID=2699 RepID=A0A845LA85_HELGE|nr:CotS family spore coat protein [Heliomicrobium gestii]MBM7865176.1 CotS family spore coat protein [Heliomicrobium gestii]MZP41445.1 CotS family spore coat protein [Heliomicrobium gestii]
MSADPRGSGIDPRVLMAYGLRPRRIEPMRGAFRIEDPGGLWVLKRFPHPVKDLQLIFRLQHHLTVRGFRRFSPIRLTPQGALCLSVGSDHWLCSGWIEGRECDFDRWRDLAVTATAVAELHYAGRGFIAPEFAGRNLWRQWPRLFATKLAQMEACRQGAERRMEQQVGTGEGQDESIEFDRLYLAHAEALLVEAREACALLDHSPYHMLMEREASEGGICHHDLAHHNVILNEEGQISFLDFDHAVMDTRLHDIGSLLIRALKRDRWSVEKGVNLLMAYHDAYPLSQGEREVLAAFLSFPNDFWQYGCAYYFESLGQPAEYHIKRLKRFLNHQKHRRRFLSEFPGRL